MMRATYSPEDNKLRLYSENRLDSETYEKVRAAGSFQRESRTLGGITGRIF